MCKKQYESAHWGLGQRIWSGLLQEVQNICERVLIGYNWLKGLFAFVCCLAVRPTMPETTALGAAMAAGMAKGVEVWTVQVEDKSQINTDIFEPAVDTHGKMIFCLPVS